MGGKMHVSKKMLAVLMGIMMAVSIPLQCNAQTASESTDFSMNNRGKTLSGDSLVKGNTDNITYGGEGDSQSVLEEDYDVGKENEIKSFATHTHTDDCYKGHRHTSSCVYTYSVPAGGASALAIRGNGMDSSLLVRDYNDLWGTYMSMTYSYATGAFNVKEYRSNVLYYNATFYPGEANYYQKRNLLFESFNWIEAASRENIPENRGMSLGIYPGYLPPISISSCTQAQDEIPDCDQVVTSITATNPVQTIKKGESLITTATYTYLDGHTGIVNCTSSFNPNIEGTRTETLTYTGLINNAKTTGTKTSNITVTVDNTPPVINTVGVNNSLNNISLDVSATDTVSLEANAYRYIIGTGSGAGFIALVDTGWILSSSYTSDYLTPNTVYSYIVKVTDNVGYISTPYERTTYTKVDKPSATITPIGNNSIKIVISDTNPANTLYSVRVGDQYSSNSGVLSPAQSEYALSTKQLVISGLQGGNKYDITVLAKETGSGLFLSGNTISITTAPDAPSNLSAGTVSNSNIYLTWGRTSGALSYELLREKLSPEGIVVESMNIKDVVTNYYNDSGLTANQTYRYRVRCKDQYSQYSAWSAIPLTVKTIPMPPEKVAGLKAGIAGKTLNISWNSIQGAIGYEVEFVSDGTPKNIFVTGTVCTIEADKYDSQCSIKVRAYNLRSESDPNNSSKWNNAGAWSDQYMCYTNANMPAFIDVQVTTNSATVTWDANDNPNSVGYVLGIYVMDSLMKEITLSDDNNQDDQLTCNVTGLLPNTNYLFRLKAINSVYQETLWSEGIMRKTLEEIPEVPGGLLISSSGTRINLAWNVSDRAKSYEIIRNDDIIATGLTDNTYIDKEVVADKDYTYKVRAVNETGYSEWSAAISAKLGVKPVAPQVSVVTGSSISVSLEWTPIEDSTGYDIEVDNVKYTTTPGTTFEHTGLIPGEEHTYRVRSRNSIGYSAWSEPVTAMTTPVTPGIPYNISAVPSNKQLLIRWEPVLDVTSYDVEINSQVYYDIPASEYLYTILGGNTEGSICKIRVRAVNKGYISEWSEEIEAIASGGSELPVIYAPAVPSITSCTAGASIVTISWDKIDGASKYQLEADGVVLYTGTNTAYVHRGLKEMSQHHYRVRAGNISGYSEWSSPFEITTTASNNTTPKNLAYYREDSSSTAIVWDGNSSVSSYRIEVNAVLLNDELTSTKTSIPTVPDKQYKIRVAALILEGENTVYDWSDEMIFNAPSNIPGIPTINSKTATSDKITITWNEVIGANGYDIDIDGQLINVNNKLTYTITNLNATTSYTIKVRAYNSSGKGSWSEASTIMTNEGIPTGAPINITVEPIALASVVSGCAIKINWNAVEGATSYEVDDQNGTIYTSNTDEITIDNLQPGIRYYFKVRALSSAGPGPWSSRISFVPVVTVPENIKITLENGMVHMSWNGVGGAKTYEIEIDGVVFTTTANTAVNFAYKTFYSQRAVRVRACNDTLKSEWSEVIFYNQPLPKTISVTDNEEISVILPVKNVNMNKYKFTLTYDSEELELLDAYEMTPKAEKGTSYLKELGVYIIRSNVDNYVSMTFVVEDGKKINWSGIVSSIRFRSKKTGNITLKYGVTLK